MELHVENDYDLKLNIQDASEDLLGKLESEYLKAYLERDPDYLKNQWEFKPKEFNVEDMTNEILQNSPDALKELKKYRDMKREQANQQDKNLLHALFDLMKFKNLAKSADFSNMKRVHDAIQSAQMLRHNVWKNEQLADFAKSKISSEVKARGLSDATSLKDALSLTGSGTLHESTMQLDAAVKEAVIANDKLQDFMDINTEVPIDMISKSPSISMHEMSEMVKELSESMMKSMSEIVESLCSLFAGASNTPTRGF